jgi:hypothetical protein
MFTRPANGPYLAPVNKVKAEHTFCVAVMILFDEVHTTETQSRMLTGKGIATEKNHHTQLGVPFRQVTS